MTSPLTASLTASLTAKARLLRSYHEQGPVLVLPNAWDPCSAAVMAQAGARAIATTSGGVAWSLGRPDGQRLSRDEMAAAVARITAAVDVPVTADMEGGYGPTPQDAARTVTAAIAAGAVGVNLEDSPGTDGPLLDARTHAQRIEAARRAAVEAGVPDLVINARTDVFLRRVGDPAGRLDEVIARAASYAEAGADVLFVPLLLDPAGLRTLVDAAPLWINAMAVPGGPSVAQFAEAGVRRISVGTAIAQAAYTAADRATRELLTEGTYDSCSDVLGFAALNAWVKR